MKNKLSKRERQVLEQMSVGHRNSKIAETLGLNDKTVGTYIKRVIEKIGLGSLPSNECNSYLIVKRAIELGLIL